MRSAAPPARRRPAAPFAARALAARALAAGVLAAGLFLAPGPPARAQQEPRDEFAEETLVTAIDLAVEARNAFGLAPPDLKPKDLVVMEEGEARPVVGVAPLGGGEGEEPWRLVIYFDLALASRDTVRSAAYALAQESSVLTGMGTVEVVVAEETPEVLLGATREPARVDNALARVYTEYPGRGEIALLRRQALAEAGAGSAVPGGAPRAAPVAPPGAAPAEVAAAAVAEERAMVRRRQDQLLTWTAADRGGGPRALFLVTDGFDLDPGELYRRQVPGVGSVGGGPRVLGEATETLARTLAAYGWVVYPVVFQDVRTPLAESTAEFDRFRQRSIDGPQGDDTVLVPFKVPLGGRKKKGDEAEEEAAAAVALVEPKAPLETLAEASGGQVLESSLAVPEVVEALGERFRVTYQVSRPFDGQVRPVEVRGRGTLRATGPAWVRSSTPEAVVEARVRRILDGEIEAGDLVVQATFKPEEPGSRTGVLEAKLDLSRPGPRPPRAEQASVRVTVAWGAEDGEPAFRHEVLYKQDLTGSFWSYGGPITLPQEAAWVLVVVEELAGGGWGSWAVEL